MLRKVTLNNYGPLTNLEWSNIGQLNLIIGENSTGKTFLLKALYSAIRTLEEYKRGNDNREASAILGEKLFWTFQADKIGDLVTKGSNEALFEAEFDNNTKIKFQWGKETIKQPKLVNTPPSLSSNSIFLPPKEVLSLHQIILKSREVDKVFGFDDTYLDLVRVLRLMPIQGRNYPQFAKVRRELKELLGGKVEYDESQARWQFKKGNQKFSIDITAEGIKKIAILDILLGNRYLDNSSMIFIDEPEAALHPTAIIKLLDCIEILSTAGIQIFLASHSYFVIKKLYLIAKKGGVSVSILNAKNGSWMPGNLADDMPDNPIIDASIKLYEEEVDTKFQ